MAPEALTASVREEKIQDITQEIMQEIRKEAKQEFRKEIMQELKQELKLELRADEELLFKSASLCPECFRLIPMLVFDKDNRVLLRKLCKEHGIVEDVYWANTELFKKAKKYEVKGRGLANPAVTVHLDNPEESSGPICPTDCGLCSLHETHSGLTNLVITNRCDLTCWYCFFYAEAAGYIYEPTMDQIEWMVAQVKGERPIAGNSFQITGGNPELREEVLEIVKAVKRGGIDHIQFNTNGTYRLYKEPGFAVALKEAGVSNLYLSFDGTTPRTNPKNHWEIPGILNSCRAANLSVVLVPTVINTVNDHDIGNILKFGFKHNDIVRAVNYQPVSLVGRMPQSEREKFRITIPDVIQRLEDHTDGQVTKDAWYPVPCTVILSNFIEALKGGPRYELSINPACGMGTYIFKDGDKMVPITDFVDIEGLFEYLKEKTEELRNGANKHWVLGKMALKLGSFIDKKKQPKHLDLGKILLNVFLKGNYKAVSKFHQNALFVGMMHFQDPYNWDIQRIKKCDIHYVTPDKERPIIPFCTFNVIPEWYRDKIQREHSVSIPEWEAKTGKTLKGGYYKRKIKELEAMPLYWDTYAGFVQPKAPAQLTVVNSTDAGACSPAGC